MDELSENQTNDVDSSAAVEPTERDNHTGQIADASGQNPNAAASNGSIANPEEVNNGDTTQNVTADEVLEAQNDNNQNDEKKEGEPEENKNIEMTDLVPETDTGQPEGTKIEETAGGNATVQPGETDSAKLEDTGDDNGTIQPSETDTDQPDDTKIEETADESAIVQPRETDTEQPDDTRIEEPADENANVPQSKADSSDIEGKGDDVTFKQDETNSSKNAESAKESPASDETPKPQDDGNVEVSQTNNVEHAGNESAPPGAVVSTGENTRLSSEIPVNTTSPQAGQGDFSIEINDAMIGGEESDEELIDEAEKASRASKRQAADEAVDAATAKLMASPVTAKFVLSADGRQQTLTFACTLGQSVGGLRSYFAEEMRLLPSMVIISHENSELEDETLLHKLGAMPNGTIEFELKSADPEVIPLRLFKPAEEQSSRDVITVKVQLDEGIYKDMIVEIERSNAHKPFLGGFRSKTSGTEYHNASMQTIRKPRPPPRCLQFNRDAQTIQLKTVVQQTTQDMATQMTGVGIFVSAQGDKLIIPKKYQSANDRLVNVVKKVIIIQKQWRKWLAKRKVEKIRLEMKKRVDYERYEEEKKIREREERFRKEYERRMNPKTKEDFDLLYQYLEKWKQDEIAVIDTELEGAERKAALCRLLDRETELLATVDRHKLAAAKETRNRSILNFLDKAASSKRWKGFDGKPTEMDTPYTIRARELRNIYATLNMRYLTQDERLDVLLTTKHTVKEFDCKLTRDIISLIDREADMLLRGVPDNMLDGLRQRISTLFLQFIKTPTFNPEIGRYLKVPQDPSILRHNVYFCSSCTRYLAASEFDLTSQIRKAGRCRQCMRLDNIARTRQDYVYYRNMLADLQRSEELYEDGSQVAFAIQESDIRYLVDNIWGAHSALSGWDDMTELILVRWDKRYHWTPWNSLMLTREEARAHLKVEYLNEVYGKSLRQTIQAKHTEARTHFARLVNLDSKLKRISSSAGKTKQLSSSPEKLPMLVKSSTGSQLTA